MNRILTLGVALAALAVLPWAVAAPGPKDAKEDAKKKFEGDWKVESWEQSGQVLEVAPDWSFKGDKYTLNLGAVPEEGGIKVDAAKNPSTIDLEITGGNCAGNTQLGIYKFDGEKLVLCLAWPGDKDRPTEFKSTAEPRTILITLKREKK
jgi:uncharacterized protein (TIGR03067 family)